MAKRMVDKAEKLQKLADLIDVVGNKVEFGGDVEIDGEIKASDTPFAIALPESLNDEVSSRQASTEEIEFINNVHKYLRILRGNSIYTIQDYLSLSTLITVSFGFNRNADSTTWYKIIFDKTNNTIEVEFAEV